MTTHSFQVSGMPVTRGQLAKKSKKNDSFLSELLFVNFCDKY